MAHSTLKPFNHAGSKYSPTHLPAFRDATMPMAWRKWDSQQKDGKASFVLLFVQFRIILVRVSWSDRSSSMFSISYFAHPIEDVKSREKEYHPTLEFSPFLLHQICGGDRCSREFTESFHQSKKWATCIFAPWSIGLCLHAQLLRYFTTTTYKWSQ